MGKTPNITSFPILIDRLIRTLYGTAEEMASKTGLGWSTISRWRRGKMRAVSEYSIASLCEATNLPRHLVWHIVDRDRDRRRKKEPIPLPDLSDNRPGPRTKQEIEAFKKRKQNGNGLRHLGAALVLVTAIAGGSGISSAATHDDSTFQAAPSRKLRQDKAA